MKLNPPPKNVPVYHWPSRKLFGKTTGTKRGTCDFAGCGKDLIGIRKKSTGGTIWRCCEGAVCHNTKDTLSVIDGHRGFFREAYGPHLVFHPGHNGKRT